MQQLRAYTMEALGTFFLVFTICCCTLFGAFTALAAAFILTAFVYAGAPLSGAHYNPAVTLGIWMRGSFSTTLVVPYIAAQLVGGLLAALKIRFVLANHSIFSELLTKRLELPQLFLAQHLLLVEFLYTFALVFIVLQVATAVSTKGNSYFGLAIGSVLLGGILAAGTVSGAALNPAVALSLAVAGFTSWSNIWIYIIANFAGGAAAALVCKFLNNE
jgi:aquaporin Z